MSAPLTVSVVNSLVVERDALSNILRAGADALAQVPGGSRLKIFVQNRTPLRDSRIVHTPDVPALLTHPHFRRSDLIVFHFGFYYDLFPAIQLAPRTAHVAAHYHGVTPPHLIDAGQRAIVNESYRQGSHLAAADLVLVGSDSLRADLRLFGVAANRTVKTALPVSFKPNPPTRGADGPTRFLFVSRFVRAKGVHDLLEGFRRAGAGADIHLDLVGSMTFSDKQYLAQLRAFVKDNELSGKVAFHFDIPAGALADRYAAAHCLVSPSHHEGFGVPIVEALSAGCYVIVSDSYASPETAGNMGMTYRTGDAESLAGRLLEYHAARERGLVPFRGGFLPPEDWAAAAAAYTATFSPAAYAEQFRTTLLAGLKTEIGAAGREYAAAACTPMLAGRPAAPAHPQANLFEKFAAVREAAKWARIAAEKKAA